MKQQDVFKKIGTILKELNEQYEYLGKDPDQLNELELELFAASANFLKDHTEILRKLTTKSAPKPVVKTIELTPPRPPVETAPPPPVNEKSEKQPVIQEEKFFEPVVQRLPPGVTTGDTEEGGDATGAVDVNEETVAAELENNGAQPEGGPETIRHELIIDEADLWDDEDEELYDNGDVVEEAEEENEPEAVETEPINTMPAEQPEPEPVPEQEPVAEEEPEAEAVETEPIKTMPAEAPAKAEKADVKEEAILTINQRISDQLGEKNRLASAPVTDLKSAINLNDKLLYIKDLFNGYSLAYSEAIEILNRFHSIEEAERFLNTNYVVKNNWESKQATTQKFYDLLRRGYA